MSNDNAPILLTAIVGHLHRIATALEEIVGVRAGRRTKSVARAVIDAARAVTAENARNARRAAKRGKESK